MEILVGSLGGICLMLRSTTELNLIKMVWEPSKFEVRRCDYKTKSMKHVPLSYTMGGRMDPGLVEKYCRRVYEYNTIHRGEFALKDVDKRYADLKKRTVHKSHGRLISRDL